MLIDPSSVWRLDETMGTSVDDAIGSVDGTHNAGVTVNATGKINNAANYTDTSTTCTDLGTTAYRFERTDSFSISCWFRTTQATVGTLIAHYDFSISRGWRLFLGDFGPGVVPNFNLSNSNSDNIWVYRSGAGGVNNDTWQHVVVTYDGSSAASGVSMYINKVLVGKTVFSDTLTATTVASVNTMLGAIGTPATPGSRFVGYLDDAAVFEGVLTQEDVDEIYDAGNTGTSVADLVGVPPVDVGESFTAEETFGSVQEFSLPLGESFTADEAISGFLTIPKDVGEAFTADEAFSHLQHFSLGLSESTAANESLGIVLPLKLIAAVAVSPTLVDLTFSHSLDLTFASNFASANYSFNPPLVIDSVAPGIAPNQVRLKTKEQTGASYTITVTTARSAPGDMLDAAYDEASFMGFAGVPTFYASAQGARKVQLTFSEEMLQNAAFSNIASYSIQDLAGNTVNISAVAPSGPAPINRVAITLSTDLAVSTYYIAKLVSSEIQTVTGLKVQSTSQIFQWNEVIGQNAIVASISVGKFSGEVTGGLFGTPAGQVFFSPALEVAAANSSIQLDEVSVCTKAFDSYFFPQPLDPPALFTFSPDAPVLSPIGAGTILWAPAERLGLASITLSDLRTDATVVPVDGPADATLEEPIDITRGAFLNDARWVLFDGVGQPFIAADNLMLIGPGPTVNINLQP